MRWKGGVNSSLNLDSHGKSWSFLILGLEIEEAGGAQNAHKTGSALRANRNAINRVRFLILIARRVTAIKRGYLKNSRSLGL